LICRALWRDIKKQVYKVIIPAASLMVKFTDVKNRRNASVFVDYVKGIACINHSQRYVEECEDGTKLLYASYQDYLDAARIFNGQGEYLGTRLDKSEFATVQYIKDTGNDGATISGIFAELASKFPTDRWNPQKVRRMMEGRADRENAQGLTGKVTGLEARAFEDEQTGKWNKRYYILGDVVEGAVKVQIATPIAESTAVEGLSQLSHVIPRMGLCKIDNNGRSQIPFIPNIPIYIDTRDNGIRRELDLADKKSMFFPNNNYILSLWDKRDNQNKKGSKDSDLTSSQGWDNVGNSGKQTSNEFKDDRNTLPPAKTIHIDPTLRFLDDIAPYKKDDVAGIGEDEALRLLTINTPKVCELVLAQGDRERFHNALKSLVREYSYGEVNRRGVIIDNVATQSNLTRTEVVALLDAAGWSPRNREDEDQIWFKPIRNLASLIGASRSNLNAGVITDLKSSGYAEHAIDDLFNTFVGGRIGQLEHYRYGAEA